MEIVELKNKIIEIINTSDERFLHMIKALYDSYNFETINEEDVVAYTINGKALTKETIIKNNENAIKSINEGNFKTHNEIRDKFALK